MANAEIYTPFINIEEAIDYFADKIRKEFDFLNFQEQTGFHEVDIKRYETRVSIVVGNGVTALAMVGITLEEFLKSLLKNKFIEENRNEEFEPSLSEIENSGLSAEINFGFYKLHNAIEKCLKERLINEEEKDYLMHVKEFIRNAFVHSDKSKIFDSSKKGNVDLIKLENDQLIKKERKEMDPLSLFFAHGVLQKQLADREAKRVFEDVEKIILKINKRYWDNRENNET